MERKTKKNEPNVRSAMSIYILKMIPDQVFPKNRSVTPPLLRALRTHRDLRKTKTLLLLIRLNMTLRDGNT